MNITLPSSVRHAIQLLNDAGFEAYVVGGCVRDYLMGKEPYDWDITTSAHPEDTLTVFSEYRTIETGLQHGTITVIVDDTPLEITTYRVDGAYTDGRHPDAVTFTPSLTEDLRRRDFTINAMAYHPNIGIVDPFGGQADLSNSVIRCVGKPMDRFTEDALRIIRGLRFASTLGFTIEDATSDAIHRLCSNLCLVSIERITAEFKRLICGVDASFILTRFSDVIAVFLPEIASNLCGRLSELPARLSIRFAALFQDANVSAEHARGALQRLRMDNQTIRQITTLLEVLPNTVSRQDASILRLLHHLGPEWIWDYFTLKRCDISIIRRTKELLDSHACYRVSMLAIDGQDLIHYGITPGPEIGRTLNELLDAVMDGVCENTKIALLAYLDKQ